MEIENKSMSMSMSMSINRPMNFVYRTFSSLSLPMYNMLSGMGGADFFLNIT